MTLTPPDMTRPEAPPLTRRHVLGGLAAGSALASTGAHGAVHAGWPLQTRFDRFDQRHLTVRQVGRKEELQAAFRTPDGAPDIYGVNRLSWLFRDWRDRDMGLLIDIRLFDLLARMQTMLTLVADAPTPLILYSGYRTPERNRTIEGAAVHSMHIVGRAADVAAVGMPRSAVVNAGEIAGAHGLGRYKLFTHVDVGKRGRRWTGASLRPKPSYPDAAEAFPEE